MRRDEDGIAVPGIADPLPWRLDVTSGDKWLFDANGVLVGLDGDTLEFTPHAANYHQRLADIVRRFVEMCHRWQHAPSGELGDFIEKDKALRAEAAALWAEMTDDAKGGGK
jgi:hypothetical protein